MEHITNVLVYSNRCEVLDSHIFNVGDRGFPHIRLKFLYMFGAETLQGKELELKYILPDKSYQTEKIRISGKDEALFPIHYSVFVNGGWTTLKVTILEGTNRITLDDIIIKTKKLEVGQEFQHKEVKVIVQAEITKRTEEIREAGEQVKAKISEDLETFYQEKIKSLNTEVKTLVSASFRENSETFNNKIDKTMIKDLSYLDSKLKITLNDNTEKEVTIKSGMILRKIEDEYDQNLEIPSQNINIGTDWKILFFTYIQYGQEMQTYVFKTSNNTSYRVGGQFEGGFELSINDGIVVVNGNVSNVKNIWVME